MTDSEAKPGVTRSLAESQYRPTSVTRLPRWLGKRRYCVGPVLSVSDSSAPSPPGSSGSGLAQQNRANASWPFLILGALLFDAQPTSRRSKPTAVESLPRQTKDFPKDLMQRRIARAEHRAG